MKKTVSVLLAFLLLLPMIPKGIAAAVSPEDTALRVARSLEIINGNEKGDLMLDKQVTRAEFVKMALSASSYKDRASAGVAVSPFPDVRNTHWAAGYIKTGVDIQIINGYTDGYFRPDNPVCLVEAVNIVLKLLGYTSSDLSGSFPGPQMSYYKSLKLDANLTAQAYDQLTRRQCVMLLYNALCAQTKTGQVYCTTLGYATDASGKIDYTAVLSDQMDGPIVVTDENWSSSLPFDLSQAESYTEYAVSSIRKNDVVYYSKNLKAVWIYRDKKTGVYSAAAPSETSPSSVIIDGTSYTIGNADAAYDLSVFGSFHPGDLVTLLLGKDGVVEGVVSGDLSDPDTDADFSQIVAQTIEGPVVASGNWTEQIDFSIQDAKIYYRGNSISQSQISEYDILYYSEPLKTIWVFRDRVTGIIDALGSPSSSPTTVTVSGKTYAIESTDASYALSSLGSFRQGDSVTLLLGKDGGIAGVIQSDLVSSILYGVITAVGTSSYPDGAGGSYTTDTVTFLATDGNSYTYPVANQYYTVGNLISATTNAGKTTISALGSKQLTGRVNAAGTAIGATRLADTVEILDVDGTRGVRIYASRLIGVTLSGNDVRYYQVNSAGEITHLILNKVTGDMHQYGVVTSVSEISVGMMLSSSYGYNIGGVDGQFTSANQVFHIVPGPSQFVMSANGISSIRNLSSVSLTSISGLNAQGPDGSYTLSSTVSVYERRNGMYYYSSLSQIADSSAYFLTGWYDKPETQGGRIRVIVAVAK